MYDRKDFVYMLLSTGRKKFIESINPNSNIYRPNTQIWPHFEAALYKQIYNIISKMYEHFFMVMTEFVVTIAV